MPNASSILIMDIRPLTAAAARQAQAAVVPAFEWQPVMMLETDFSNGTDVSGTALAAAGDVWNITVAPPSAMPGFVFYCISMRMSLVTTTASAAAAALFADEAAYSIQPPESNRYWVWDSVDMLAARSVFDGSAARTIRSCSPTFRGAPARPGSARSSVVANNAQGGFQVSIGTWDAGAAAITSAHVDARFLGFKQILEDSAGFYQPRLGFQPN